VYDQRGKIKKNWFVVWAAMLALTVSNIFYTNVVQHQTEQKFCNVITPITAAYRETPTPPSTELGRLLKSRYEQLSKDLNCE